MTPSGHSRLSLNSGFMKTESAEGLSLRKVHAAQQVLEPRVGAHRIPDRLETDVRQVRAADLKGLPEPLNAPVVVAGIDTKGRWYRAW